MVFERFADEVGDDIARQVVVGRPETAGENQQIASPQRIRHDRFQHVAVVAGHGLPLQVDAQLVEPLGNEERIGIEMRGRQHLAAHRDNLCSHDNQPGAR